MFDGSAFARRRLEQPKGEGISWQQMFAAELLYSAHCIVSRAIFNNDYFGGVRLGTQKSGNLMQGRRQAQLFVVGRNDNADKWRFPWT
jgi:hypothetical protein